MINDVPAAPAASLPPPMILLLDGDAEARLLADAQAACDAVFAGREISVLRAWSTRPDWLAAAGPAPPPVLVQCGALPDLDVRALLATSPRLVIVSLLPAVTQPGLRHRDGGAFVAPQGLRACWTPELAARITAECREEPPMSPAEAIAALEPIILQLQEQGTAVAVCTAFRHVRTPFEASRGAEPQALRGVIRHLNLEIARLSQRTGCFVLDLDRPLAHEGGATLDADYRGGEGRAAELALDEFAALLLDALPDEIMPPEFL